MVSDHVEGWTLADELCQLSGSDSTDAALVSLGLARGLSAQLLDTSHQWRRGGAETYVYEFRVREAGRTRKFIVKACLSLGGVSATVDEWVKRRRLLEGAGVAVPVLYGAQNGVIVEEYIPFELRAVYNSSDAVAQERIRGDVLGLARRILSCGFAPTSLHDLRSHGEDIVVIDFGADLGGPLSTPLPASDLKERADRLARSALPQTRDHEWRPTEASSELRDNASEGDWSGA